MIDRDDYTVRMVDDLPASVGGFISESPDGHLNIYINARHGWKGQRRSLRHELRHADADDLRSSEPLAVIEARANGSDVRLASIPNLLRARDLLPGPPPTVPQRTPNSHPTAHQLTPRQLAIIRRALVELDNCFLTEPYDF